MAKVSSETLQAGLGVERLVGSRMAAILLMTLLVPVVVWIAVRLEHGLDRWDSTAAVLDQPPPGESDETPVPEQARPAA